MPVTRSQKRSCMLASPAPAAELSTGGSSWTTVQDERSSEHKDESDESSVLSFEDSNSIPYTRKRARPSSIEPRNSIAILGCEETLELPEPMHVQDKSPQAGCLGIIDVDHMVTAEYDGTYAKDIIEFKRSLEHKSVLATNYFRTTNTGLSERMRSILVDWLIDIMDEFKLRICTAHLATLLLDRVLSARKVPKEELQLYGATSLLIAAKLEETNPPTVQGLVFVSDKSFTAEQVTQTESIIVSALRFDLYLPTKLAFLDRYLLACKANERERQFSHYLAELSLQEFVLGFYKPSLVAAGIVHITRQLLHPTHEAVWTSSLEYHTRYRENDLVEVTLLLRKMHELVSQSKLTAIFNRYNCKERCFASRELSMRLEDIRFGS